VPGGPTFVLSPGLECKARDADLEVPIEELVERGRRPRRAFLVDLMLQPGERLLGLPLCGRAGRDRLAQVELPFVTIPA
jgi:hypothetical protein